MRKLELRANLLFILGVPVLTLLAALIGPRLLRPKPKPVAPVVVVPTAVPTEIVLSGRVEPRTVISVPATIAGILDAWFVEPGQEIYKDQLIGRIRSAALDEAVHSAQAALDQAEAAVAQLEAQAPMLRLEISRTAADKARAHNELDRAEKVYQRQKALMDAGATARVTFEKAEHDFNTAKADVDARDAAAKAAEEKFAQFDRDLEASKRTLTQQTDALEKAKAAVTSGDIHSPSDGFLVDLKIRAGESVDSSTKDLATIAADTKSLQTTLTPDPASLARLHSGQAALVQLTENSQVALPGQVRDIHGHEVIVDFTDPAGTTKLGAAVQVKIKF